MVSLKQNFAYNIFYQVLAIILPLITAPYVSRVLGAEGLGIYSYTSSIANYFMLFAMLGIANHGNRSIASTTRNKQALGACFVNNYVIQLFAGMIVTLLYVGYILIFRVRNKTCALIQILVVLSGVLDINWFFWGLEKFKITVIRNTICKVISVLCIFAFVRNSQDLWIYVLIMSLTIFISQLLLWSFLLNEIEFQKPKWSEVKRNLKPIIVLFFPILAYSLYRIMDKIMIGSFSTMDQLGYYDNAEKILNIPIGIITALGNVMLPRISHLLSKGDRGAQAKYIRMSLLFVSIVEGALCFGIAAVSDVFVQLYYGAAFAKSGSILKVLIFTALISGWANVIRTQYLIPMHADNIYVTSMLSAAGLNLVLNWIFIPQFGAMGALIGTVSAELTILVIQIVSVRKNFSWGKLFAENIPYILSGLTMFVLVRILDCFMIGPNLLKLIAEIAVGGAVYIGMVTTICAIQKNVIYDFIMSYIRKIR